jgi:imidazolonepropionase-like amidohydrolase
MRAIKNAHILTMAGQEYESGCVTFDKVIRYVGDRLPEGSYETVLDAKGAYLLPGLVDAHCHVGMFEDSLGFEGDDGNEDSDPITPQLRAIDALNPFDRAFSDAAKAGVTTVVTGPGSANPIGGQFAAVKTHGVCIDDMIVKAPAAMKLALGENPKTVYHGKSQTPVTRMGTVAMIRETLEKAKEYQELWTEYKQAPEDNDKPEFDSKLDALLPVIRRELPVKIHAHRADDICTAIRIAKEFDLDVTIEHCTDGEAVAEILAREKVPIMLGPTLSDRSKPELRSMSFSIYQTLSSLGLDVAIITDHPEIPIEHLPLCAALAVKNGMDETLALEAITIRAAKNCRIENRVGSIEVGKDADFCVYGTLPTRFGADNLCTVIDGAIIYSSIK